MIVRSSGSRRISSVGHHDGTKDARMGKKGTLHQSDFPTKAKGSGIGKG